eukprot:Opistho-1_new@32808
MSQKGLGHAAIVAVPVHSAVTIDLVADPPGDTDDLPLHRRGRAAWRHQHLPQFRVLVLPGRHFGDDRRYAVMHDPARHRRHVEQHVKPVQRGAGFIHMVRIEPGAVKLEIRPNPLDQCLHLRRHARLGLRVPAKQTIDKAPRWCGGRLACVEQQLGHLCPVRDLDVAAPLQRVDQRRLPTVVARIGTRAMRQQDSRAFDIAAVRCLVQRRTPSTLPAVHIRAKVQQHLDLAAPVPRLRMQWCLSVSIRRFQIRTAFDQPARQRLRATAIRQRGLFKIAAARIEFARFEYRFERVEVARLDQRIEVLWQGLPLHPAQIIPPNLPGANPPPHRARTGTAPPAPPARARRRARRRDRPATAHRHWPRRSARRTSRAGRA